MKRVAHLKLMNALQYQSIVTASINAAEAKATILHKEDAQGFLITMSGAEFFVPNSNVTYARYEAEAPALAPEKPKEKRA